MYYWNKDNFEGLLQVAGALESVPQLAPLAEYCRLRERGLRKQAFAALRKFLSDAKTWVPEHARERVVTIVELHARIPKAHTFMSNPLWEQLVLPVLETWVRECPADIIPMRWLGLLKRNTEYLRSALAILPEDIPVRRKLVDLALADVEFATHHLDETVFLGSVDDAAAALREAGEWLNAATPVEMFADLRQNFEHLNQVLLDWKAYQAAPDGSFPQWCRSKGRSYHWGNKFYYDA